jgi:hypothetical protein
MEKVHGYMTGTSAIINVELPDGMVKNVNYDIVTQMATKGRTSTVTTIMSSFKPSSHALAIAFTHDCKLESVSKARKSTGFFDSVEKDSKRAVTNYLRDGKDTCENFTNLAHTLPMGTSSLVTPYGIPTFTKELPANLHGVDACLTNGRLNSTQRTSLTNMELDKVCFVITKICGRSVEHCMVSDRTALLRFCQDENRDIKVFRVSPDGSYCPIDSLESIQTELDALDFKPNSPGPVSPEEESDSSEG